MALRKRKPTSAGRRFQTVSDFSEITKTTPERTLLAPGHAISRLIRGGWQLSASHSQAVSDDPVGDMIAFADAGITTFDCADIYTGVEEMIVTGGGGVASLLEAPTSVVASGPWTQVQGQAPGRSMLRGRCAPWRRRRTSCWRSTPTPPSGGATRPANGCSASRRGPVHSSSARR